MEATFAADSRKGRPRSSSITRPAAAHDENAASHAHGTFRKENITSFMADCHYGFHVRQAHLRRRRVAARFHFGAKSRLTRFSRLMLSWRAIR